MLSAQPQSYPTDQIYPVVRDIVAQTLIYDVEEISLDTSFDEDDLDVLGTPEHERILLQVKNHFQDYDLDLRPLRECITIAELVSLIEEEREFAKE